VIFGNDDLAKVGVVWVRPDIPHKVYLSLAALHKMEIAGRQLYVFCPTEGTPELQQQMEQELAASETPLEFKTRAVDVQDLDLGLIVDLEKPGPDDRMLVSLVLLYSFLDRKNVQLLWFYEYISRHLKWLLRFVQEKGWLFKGV
jgi:hypothetical protein